MPVIKKNRVRPMAPGHISEGGIFRFLLCIICLVFVAGYFYPAPVSAAAPGYWPIGALLDLTGPGKVKGAEQYDAMMLAIQDINSQGGVKGRLLDLSVFDTRGDKGELLAGAERLRRDHHALLLLGPTNAANVAVLRSYAESKKIPVILIQGQEPLIKSRKLRTYWTFATTVNFDAELKALFSYFRKKRCKFLGGLLENSPESRKIALWIRGYSPEYGLKIQCFGAFNPNQEDIGLKIRQLNRCEPDIAILWGNWQIAPLIQANLPVLQVPLAISHHVFFHYPSALQIPATSLIYAALPPVLFWQGIPGGTTTAFLVARFLNAWGQDAFQDLPVEQQLAVAQAWDGIHLAARGIAFSYRVRSAVIRESIEQKIPPFVGVTGTYSPDKRNHSKLLPGSLITIRCMGARWSAVKNR